jgi:hypothetical protein
LIHLKCHNPQPEKRDETRTILTLGVPNKEKVLRNDNVGIYRKKELRVC